MFGVGNNFYSAVMHYIQNIFTVFKSSDSKDILIVTKHFYFEYIFEHFDKNHDFHQNVK